VTPLYRAVALAEMNNRSEAIAEHLYFDMACINHGAL
jgi:hypothetical protein